MPRYEEDTGFIDVLGLGEPEPTPTPTPKPVKKARSSGNLESEDEKLLEAMSKGKR